MSAAVARPPLFSHLVASRPDRERESFGATVASIVLHAGFIAAAVLLSAQVRTPVTTVREEPVILVQPPELPIEANVPARRGGGGGGIAAPQAPTLPAPIEIPITIPAPGDQIAKFERPYPISAAKVGSPGPVTGQPGEGVGPGVPVVVTQLPRLLNRPEIERHMVRFYPNNLLQAGIGGTPIVWLRLDEEGHVLETQLKVSSGQRALDEAALEVGKRARFSPAYNGDARVRVWVELPIVFQARN